MVARLWDYLKSLWNRSVDRSTEGAKPQVPSTDKDIVFKALSNQVCPDCGTGGFFEGPSGGLSSNIKCSNLECGSEFCVAWCNGAVFFANRTDRSEAESIQLYGQGYGPLHKIVIPYPD